MVVVLAGADWTEREKQEQEENSAKQGSIFRE